MIGEYTLTGFNDRYTVAASYNKANGCLEINAQLLGINGNEAVSGLQPGALEEEVALHGIHLMVYSLLRILTDWDIHHYT